MPYPSPLPVLAMAPWQIRHSRIAGGNLPVDGVIANARDGDKQKTPNGWWGPSVAAVKPLGGLSEERAYISLLSGCF